MSADRAEDERPHVWQKWLILCLALGACVVAIVCWRGPASPSSRAKATAEKVVEAFDSHDAEEIEVARSSMDSLTGEFRAQVYTELREMLIQAPEAHRGAWFILNPDAKRGVVDADFITRVLRDGSEAAVLVCLQSGAALKADWPTVVQIAAHRLEHGQWSDPMLREFAASLVASGYQPKTRQGRGELLDLLLQIVQSNAGDTTKWIACQAADLRFDVAGVSGKDIMAPLRVDHPSPAVKHDGFDRFIQVATTKRDELLSRPEPPPGPRPTRSYPSPMPPFGPGPGYLPPDANGMFIP